MSSIRPHDVGVPIATGLGLLGLSTGLYGLANPTAFVATLGVPLTPTSSHPVLPFVSFVAARNLGTGISILTLLYNGQRTAVGTVLVGGVVVAMADAWICAQYGAEKGKAVAHAVMGTVIGAVGGVLYWG